jgi:hypothetical protein
MVTSPCALLAGPGIAAAAAAAVALIHETLGH